MGLATGYDDHLMHGNTPDHNLGGYFVWTCATERHPLSGILHSLDGLLVVVNRYVSMIELVQFCNVLAGLGCLPGLLLHPLAVL